MNPLTNLSPGNLNEVKKFLRFLKLKRDGTVRSLTREFSDAKSDRLSENLFSREDMEDYSDYLASEVGALVSSEVGNIINMSALALGQLLENAQSRGLDLEFEIASLENQSMINAVESLSLNTIATSPKKAGALASFADEAKALKTEQERLSQLNLELENQVSQLRRQLTEANRRVSSLAADAKASEEDSRLRDRVRDLDCELAEAKEENARKVADSKQFQQMRKIMQKQTLEIKRLRERLQVFEPDDCKEEKEDF